MITLVQMEYALAVAEHGSFSKAARASFVTQPTLSMQVQKLEEDLGVTLFDRTRKPIEPTAAGTVLLEQFRRVIAEVERIEQLTHSLKGKIAGPYTLGVIPTVAPFLLPRILGKFRKSYPEVSLRIREIPTDEIITALKDGKIDAGILATPLGDPKIHEEHLYNEPLCVYRSESLELKKTKDGVRVRDLPFERIVLMNEGHCLRTQVIDLCALEDRQDALGFTLETASVSTLIRAVDQGELFTVLPLLATADLPEATRRRQVLSFTDVSPFREIGLATYRRDVKEAIHGALVATIKDSLPPALRRGPGGEKGRRQERLLPPK